MANYLPPSAYYAEPLSVSQMRGAQLGQMRQSNEMRKAKMDAEMAAYGASSPRELMTMQATGRREEAMQAASQKKVTDFFNVMADLDDIRKSGDEGPARAKEIWNQPEIQAAVSPYIKDYDPTVEGDAFVVESPFEGMIKPMKGDVFQGMTVVGKSYVPVNTAEGEYFKEVPLTRKLAGKSGKEVNVGKILQRQAKIEDILKDYKAIGGFTSSSMQMMIDMGMKVNEADPTASIAALERERDYLERQLPESERKRKSDASKGAVMQSAEDYTSDWIMKNRCQGTGEMLKR